MKIERRLELEKEKDRLNKSINEKQKRAKKR